MHQEQNKIHARCISSVQSEKKTRKPISLRKVAILGPEEIQKLGVLKFSEKIEEWNPVTPLKMPGSVGLSRKNRFDAKRTDRTISSKYSSSTKTKDGDPLRESLGSKRKRRALQQKEEPFLAELIETVFCLPSVDNGENSFKVARQAYQQKLTKRNSAQ